MRKSPSPTSAGSNQKFEVKAVNLTGEDSFEKIVKDGKKKKRKSQTNLDLEFGIATNSSIDGGLSLEDQASFAALL